MRCTAKVQAYRRGLIFPDHLQAPDAPTWVWISHRAEWQDILLQLKVMHKEGSETGVQGRWGAYFFHYWFLN